MRVLLQPPATARATRFAICWALATAVLAIVVGVVGPGW